VFDEDSLFQEALNETIASVGTDSMLNAVGVGTCDYAYELLHDYSEGKIDEDELLNGFDNILDERSENE
jgi:hypothetical protein